MMTLRCDRFGSKVADVPGDALLDAVPRRLPEARRPGVVLLNQCGDALHPERKLPVGPASAKKLGYDPQEIDALPTSVTESFCGVDQWGR
jgi:hypothetical protein